MRREEMSVSEAESVLGLSGVYDAVMLTKAYRRCIARAHPDAGGSVDEAVRVNIAKETLERKLSRSSSGRVTASSSASASSGTYRRSPSSHGSYGTYDASFWEDLRASAVASDARRAREEERNRERWDAWDSVVDGFAERMRRESGAFSHDRSSFSASSSTTSRAAGSAPSSSYASPSGSSFWDDVREADDAYAERVRAAQEMYEQAVRDARRAERMRSEAEAARAAAQTWAAGMGVDASSASGGGSGSSGVSGSAGSASPRSAASSASSASASEPFREPGSKWKYGGGFWGGLFRVLLFVFFECCLFRLALGDVGDMSSMWGGLDMLVDYVMGFFVAVALSPVSFVLSEFARNLAWKCGHYLIVVPSRKLGKLLSRFGFERDKGSK